MSFRLFFLASSTRINILIKINGNIELRVVCTIFKKGINTILLYICIFNFSLDRIIGTKNLFNILLFSKSWKNI